MGAGLPAPLNAARGGHVIMSVDNSSAPQTVGLDPSRARVAGAIKQASNISGVSFQYMLTTAKMESDFDPTAGATTSSAHGLYQFIDQTWLGTVKEAGAQLGYGSYAEAITRTPSGTYTVDDPAMKRSIMKLRDDPEAASTMAAALTQSNGFKLTGLLGRRPSDSEPRTIRKRSARGCFPTRRPPIARSSMPGTAARAACPRSTRSWIRAMPARQIRK
jgi:hypothetical protein